MGLFGYKKVIHPVRTTRRAAMRSVTPKPIRKVRRAAITVRHPGSSLEGAAKASLSRSVSRGSRRRSQPNGGALVAVLTLLAYLVVAVAIFAWLLLKLCWLFVVSVINAISQRKTSTGQQVAAPAPRLQRPSSALPTAAVTSEHYEQLLGLPPE